MNDFRCSIQFNQADNHVFMELDKYIAIEIATFFLGFTRLPIYLNIVTNQLSPD